MDLIYSSENFWILSYPAQQSFELFNKQNQQTLLLEGESAWHFHHAMQKIPKEERNVFNIDDWLDDYCSGRSKPIVMH